MVKNKFHVTETEDTFIIRDIKCNTIALYKNLPKYQTPNNQKKDIDTFFRGFHLFNSPSWNIPTNRLIDSCHYTNEETKLNFEKFILRIKEIACKGSWYYKKYSFYSVYEDYTYALSSLNEDFNLQDAYNYLESLNKYLKNFVNEPEVSIFWVMRHLGSKFKLRRDIYRIIREKNVYVDEGFISFHQRKKEHLYNMIVYIYDNDLFEELNLTTTRHILSKDKSMRIICLDKLYHSNIYELVELGYDLKSIFEQYINYYGIYENLEFKEYLNNLHDYASMHDLMEVKKYKKFPRYLKSNHDIVTREYSLYRQNFDEKLFRKQVNDDLQYLDKKFLVETPKNTDDLKNEGKILSHCVGSYIDRVIRGTTQIVFLREKQGVPQATIEIKNNMIVQAKAYSNQPLSKVEKKYLEIYARAKDLIVKC